MHEICWQSVGVFARQSLIAHGIRQQNAPRSTVACKSTTESTFNRQFLSHYRAQLPTTGANQGQASQSKLAGGTGRLFHPQRRAIAHESLHISSSDVTRSTLESWYPRPANSSSRTPVSSGESLGSLDVVALSPHDPRWSAAVGLSKCARCGCRRPDAP